MSPSSGIISQKRLYWLITENLDWNSAMHYCRSKNTDLIIIANRREQESLARVLSKEHGKFLCCGLEIVGLNGSTNR